ncbi:MAG: MBL fold metallo-hydrolase, partial [Candidatus Heimdallarchaeota archaeon]|nr:MBL fold metallo-hydrolase [Candidatus Heimdallarchaeota archaeon]MCK4955953.1 MBL fold metallo-hydrolase [Candidatus Heimdallarchaeota archaeon]
MTSITIHGAAGEIGGNKILIEDKDTKIFLDFGLSFSKWGNYFTPYLQPRKWSYLSDFTKMGILPDLEGLYRPDFENRIRKSKKEPEYDAVVLSHPHLDHAGFLSYIRTEIPVHCSPGCKGILQAFEETAAGFHEYTRIKESFKLRVSKTDSSKKVRDTKSSIPRKINLFKPKIAIDDLTLHTFPVDHSIIGATSFVIETSEGAIVYTGDIRFHGRQSNYSKLFVEKASEFDPVVMLSEGTRVRDRSTFGELDLERKLYSLVSDVDGLVIVNFPIRDTDRMKSFIAAAKSVDRTLVINMKQAYTLRLLEQYCESEIPTLDDVSIYIPRKGWGILNNDNYPDYIQMKDYLHWEKELINRPNSVTDEDIKENPKNYIFRCDFYELKYLFDVDPPEGSKYIRSVTEPVDEEMELEKVKADNWLKLFNLYPYEQIHCSGHASGVEIEEMIDQISPKTVIPIHTETPEVFGDFHSNTVVKKLG